MKEKFGIHQLTPAEIFYWLLFTTPLIAGFYAIDTFIKQPIQSLPKPLRPISFILPFEYINEVGEANGDRQEQVEAVLVDHLQQMIRTAQSEMQTNPNMTSTSFYVRSMWGAFARIDGADTIRVKVNPEGLITIEWAIDPQVEELNQFIEFALTSKDGIETNIDNFKQDFSEFVYFQPPLERWKNNQLDGVPNQFDTRNENLFLADGQIQDRPLASINKSSIIDLTQSLDADQATVVPVKIRTIQIFALSSSGIELEAGQEGRMVDLAINFVQPVGSPYFTRSGFSPAVQPGQVITGTVGAIEIGLRGPLTFTGEVWDDLLVDGVPFIPHPEDLRIFLQNEINSTN